VKSVSPDDQLSQDPWPTPNQHYNVIEHRLAAPGDNYRPSQSSTVRLSELRLNRFYCVSLFYLLILLTITVIKKNLNLILDCICIYSAADSIYDPHASLSRSKLTKFLHVFRKYNIYTRILRERLESQLDYTECKYIHTYRIYTL